jgi:hypothetical protein
MIARPTPLLFLTLLVLLSPFCLQGQDLPAEMYFSPAEHMLHTGGQPSTGLYEKPVIRTIDLYFSQPNYWTLLQQNYQSKTNLAATMVVDGVTYDSVGVRFKGNTSYTQVPAGSQKRSFNIQTDHVHAAQDLMGYETLNLNNGFQDASFLREVIFLDLIRDHIPAAKANFVHLNINGENWGLYPNVQQLNNEFVKEWFFSNNGSLWRADRPDGQNGGGGGGGPNWGDGTAALNYLGADTTPYQTYYTLKRTEQVDPWADLVTTCHRLNTLPTNMLVDSLPLYLDIDRVLWFLASEIAFSDDDSYVYKGKMDYYLYWDEETGRMTPLEFDGNSVMKGNAVTWSAFYNATNVNYPLLNKLLNVPVWRQRYLAHLRTIISEKMQSASFNALLASWSSLINAEVQADPKKLYTYTAYQNELTVLQNFITNRRNNLLANAEVAQVAPVISQAVQRVNGVDWAQPTAAEEVQIRCTVSSNTGIYGVTLYHAQGLTGTFSALPMYDDGQHNDGAAGDGIYGASLPAAPAMTHVRWYIEAAANNAARSVSYAPPGAEHDIFIYQVAHTVLADSPVRINEVMAWNTFTMADEALQFDDWIELFNVSNDAYDLGGHWLSDSGLDIQKWQFPAGTVLGPGEYLIIWADNDLVQGPLHASFGLNAAGESVYLSTAGGDVMDLVEFGPQEANMGYARVPNGTGPFVIQSPTFAGSNDLFVSVQEPPPALALAVFPNPVRDVVSLLSGDPQEVRILDALGRVLWAGRVSGRSDIDVSGWAGGSYLVQHSGGVKRLLVVK